MAGVVGPDLNDEFAVALVHVPVRGGGGPLKGDMARQVKTWTGGLDVLYSSGRRESGRGMRPFSRSRARVRQSPPRLSLWQESLSKAEEWGARRVRLGQCAAGTGPGV
jgi:hypothetical protein